MIEKALFTHDGWICHTMIFVECGKGYGVDDEGHTVCLGDMVEVELYLKDSLSEKLSPVAIRILESIKIMEAKSNGDQPKIIRTGDIRSRPSRNFKHRAGTTRRSPSAKRTPICKVK